MLADPRHNLTLDFLVDWLRTQPPNEQYFYSRGTECMCAQALKAAGFSITNVGVMNFWIGERMQPLPPDWNEIAAGDRITFSHQTYGHALQRALAYREQQRAAA